jgi:dolichol-phosphate mannosyltransferase
MAVGVSGVFVNLGALWYLKSFIGMSELVAGALAIELSILSNFLLNDFWTFRDRRRGRFVHRLIKCHGSAIGPLVNFVTLVVLVWVGVHYLVSDAIGILLGFAANYLFSETVIWS